MQPAVAREIDHTHAAFAEFVGDVVMRYDLSEHVAPSGRVACPVCRYYTPATGTRRVCVDSTNRQQSWGLKRITIERERSRANTVLSQAAGPGLTLNSKPTH